MNKTVENKYQNAFNADVRTMTDAELEASLRKLREVTASMKPQSSYAHTSRRAA